MAHRHIVSRAVGGLLIAVGGGWLVTWGSIVAGAEPPASHPFWTLPTWLAVSAMIFGLLLLIVGETEWRPRRMARMAASPLDSLVVGGHHGGSIGALVGLFLLKPPEDFERSPLSGTLIVLTLYLSNHSSTQPLNLELRLRLTDGNRMVEASPAHYVETLSTLRTVYGWSPPPGQHESLDTGIIRLSPQETRRVEVPFMIAPFSMAVLEQALIDWDKVNGSEVRFHDHLSNTYKSEVLDWPRPRPPRPAATP